MGNICYIITNKQILHICVCVIYQTYINVKYLYICYKQILHMHVCVIYVCLLSNKNKPIYYTYMHVWINTCIVFIHIIVWNVCNICVFIYSELPWWPEMLLRRKTTKQKQHKVHYLYIYNVVYLFPIVEIIISIFQTVITSGKEFYLNCIYECN